MNKNTDEIVKRLTPQFPIGYSDMYYLVEKYLTECKKHHREYNEEVLLILIQFSTIKGVIK